MFGSLCPRAAHAIDEKDTGRYGIDGTNLEFMISYSCKDLPEDLEKCPSLFMNRTYLSILEQFPSKGMEFIYLTVYEYGQCVGIILAQSVDVKGNEALQVNHNDQTTRGKTQRWILKRIKLKGFVVGNLLLTGNYGVQFKNKSVRESFVIVDIITKFAIPIIEKNKGVKFSLQFYKDFSGEEAAQSSSLLQSGFNCFTGEPSMVLEISPSWSSFEDYLAAMSSKYRVRAKRAFKKGKDIIRQELTYEEIFFYKKKIHELYKNVSKSSEFNLVHLDEDYFPELKKQLKDKYKLIAYFLNGEMIAFCTTIDDHKETHAHFLGMDHSFNSKYQLYLNILYDIIRIGIECNSTLVDFARTAPEIKSSVGAEPQELYVFIKHRNKFSNRFVKRVFTYLEPKKEIVYRNPFKNKGEGSKKEKNTSTSNKSKVSKAIS